MSPCQVRVLAALAASEQADPTSSHAGVAAEAVVALAAPLLGGVRACVEGGASGSGVEAVDLLSHIVTYLDLPVESG